MQPMDETNNRNLELVNVAIRKLLDDRRTTLAARDAVVLNDDDTDHRLLSQLLSQVESLNVSASIRGSEDAKNNEAAGIAADEIAKELRHVKRQNTITHWLLSIMIVVTVAWQLSEMTMILKVKESLSHPLRSVGKMVSGFFRGKAPAVERDAEKDKLPTAEQDNNSILPAIPPIKIPELPMIDLTNFPAKDDDSD